jgi:GT2 family glycosyltransferase
LILFIGDDIVAAADLLAEHVSRHRQYPQEHVGVLGFITWSPEIEISPFMRWLENGTQFGYPHLEGHSEADAEVFFLSSNISLKTDFLLRNGFFFDEEFPYAAFEDIELGGRLKRSGLILKYNKKALGYHYHPTSLAEACQRMIKVGASWCILAKKSGKAFEPPRRWGLWTFLRTIEFRIHLLAAKYYEKKAVKKTSFACVMNYYYRMGNAIGAKALAARAPIRSLLCPVVGEFQSDRSVSQKGPQ